MPQYKHQRAIDLLAESRRYVRSNPEAARDLHLQARGKLMTTPDINQRLLDRLLKNLLIGQESRFADPDVFEGYITGAIHELQCLGWEDP